jgi:hypothetical protein
MTAYKAMSLKLFIQSIFPGLAGGINSGNYFLNIVYF